MAEHATVARPYAQAAFEAAHGAGQLAKLFVENFEKYTDTPAGEALVSAGPKL